MAIISAGGNDFTLPKGLLCYQSTFFDKPFNGKFKEAKEQKLTLTDCSSETFQFVVQWIFSTQVVLPTHHRTNSLPNSNAEGISKLLAFLKVADEINLLGPFDQVIETMRSTLKLSRASLQSSHITTAFEIPSAHNARKLFIQACIKDYSIELHQKSTLKASPFRFQNLLEKSAAFAAALLKEVRVAFQSRIFDRGQTTFLDPLLSERFSTVN